MLDISVTSDFAEARTRAAIAADILAALRERYDLAPFEFTREVRIAPLEDPHSHPVLTLSTAWNRDEDGFLATYLHQQICRYLADHRAAALEAVIPIVESRYPAPPHAARGWNEDANAVYRRLVANWLEIEAVATLIGYERATARFRKAGAHRWAYMTAARDRAAIGGMLADAGIAPMPDARTLSGKARG